MLAKIKRLTKKDFGICKICGDYFEATSFRNRTLEGNGCIHLMSNIVIFLEKNKKIVGSIKYNFSQRKSKKLNKFSIQTK